ncbi:MAG: thiamine biosynthesis protein ThiS [Acidocella sp. 20-61-6]|nr:MAG: thiamine biosynthesis protein ThiS [Acidocella sp. 20-61-6]
MGKTLTFFRRNLKGTTLTKLRLNVNDEPREVTAGASVAELLAELGLDTRKVAVERNREIVPRSTYAKVRLAEGDALEIVHFIGGG